MAEIRVIFYGVLIFLLPFGLYCLALAYVNRWPRPVVVHGGWDMVGMLAAGSGLFLLLFPMLLATAYQRAVAMPTEDSHESFEQLWWRYWLLWAAYYLGLAAVSAALIWWRSRSTAIYNVEVERVAAALPQAAAQLNLTCFRANNSFEIRAASPAHATPGVALVRLDPFAAGSHVTLHWDAGSPWLRQRLEAMLPQVLAEAAPHENPVAGVFMLLSGCIFGGIIFVVSFYLLLAILARRG